MGNNRNTYPQERASNGSFMPYRDIFILAPPSTEREEEFIYFHNILILHKLFNRLMERIPIPPLGQGGVVFSQTII